MTEPLEAPAGEAPESRRLHGDDGANLVEYAMLIALIFVVCLSAVAVFGKVTTGKTDCVATAISAVDGSADC